MAESAVRLCDYLADASAYPFLAEAGPPWAATSRACRIVADLVAVLGPLFSVRDGVAVHARAVVEPGAIVKAPAVISANCLVAAGAYLRGGVFLAEDCIVGPGSEVKSSFLMPGAKLAHLNFVGDSILGARVNCEAGSIIANHRNERADKRIRIGVDGQAIDTGVDKFGALLGDGVRLGANAVVAPGALIPAGAVVPRLGLVDQGLPE